MRTEKIDIKQSTQKDPTPWRWKKGQTGNPNGRPRKPEIEILRRALQEARDETGKDFLQHFVKRAYDSDEVAVALARKLIPDKSTQDLEIQEYLHDDIKGMTLDDLFKRRDSIIKRIVEVGRGDRVQDKGKPAASVQAPSAAKGILRGSGPH